MKRRNLFLSLISSVLVAIAIVTVTICTVVQPKKKNEQGGQIVTPIVDVKEEDNSEYVNMNELERDGSEEKPYVIYSADSFVALLEKYGENKDMHFELVKDIDFAGFNYKGVDGNGFVTLFNNGKTFKGTIFGKGFALKNITIDVTAENIESNYSYVETLKNANGDAVGTTKFSRIALFGAMEGASIKELTIDNMSVKVASEVYDYVAGKGEQGLYGELSVASLAGIAKDVTLEKVNINASIEGSSYINNFASANNAIGGIVASVEGLNVTDSNINVSITANAGTEYLVGGIAGYGRNSKIAGGSINVEIKTTASRGLLIAGVFGFANKFDGSDFAVNFKVSETESEEAVANYVNALTTDKDGNAQLAKAGEMSTVAGLIGILRANDSNYESNFTNITVNSNVKFAGMFAGVVFDVYSTNKVTFGLVEFKDVVVNADVDVLVGYAFARQLVASTIDYSDEKIAEAGYTNIKLSGNVKFKEYTGTVLYVDVLTKQERVVTKTYDGARIIMATDLQYADYLNKELFIEVSSQFDGMIRGTIDGTSSSNNMFGSYKIVG